MADYRNVPDPELVARRGLFVAEGRLVVTRLLASASLVTRSVLLTETAYAAIHDALDRRPDVAAYIVSQHVMNDVIGFNIHRGCLALGERPAPPPWRRLAAEARGLVVLERVGDADNVGSVFRNAAAFGADGVLLGPACADPLYRKAIRTSMGAALALPFSPVLEWPEALSGLADMGFVTIGLTPGLPERLDGVPHAPTASALRDVAATARRERWALVLGHEGDGLTPAALDAVRLRARIPMAPGTDSLNVAAAAAVALYELRRG